MALITNAQFADARGAPFNNNLTHGRLEVSGNDGNMYRIFFQYNPSSVQVTYAANLQQLTPSGWNTPPSQQGQSPGESAAQPMNSLVTVSVGLLFDRRVDLWQNLIPEGVMHDTRRLEQAYGIFPRGQMSGAMYMNPTTIFFSDSHFSSNPDPNYDPSFSYQGYLAGMDISYTMFSNQMVPTMATVQLSLGQVMGAIAAPTGPGSSTTVPPAAPIPTPVPAIPNPPGTKFPPVQRY